MIRVDTQVEHRDSPSTWFFFCLLVSLFASPARHISRNQVILHRGVIFPHISMDHWSIQQQESKPFSGFGPSPHQQKSPGNRFLLHQGELKRFLDMGNVHQITQVKDCQKGYNFEDLWPVRKDDPLSKENILNGWGELHHFFRFWIFLQSVWSSLACIADGDSGHLLGYLRARSRVAP